MEEEASAEGEEASAEEEDLEVVVEEDSVAEAHLEEVSLAWIVIDVYLQVVEEPTSELPA